MPTACPVTLRAGKQAANPCEDVHDCSFAMRGPGNCTPGPVTSRYAPRPAQTHFFRACTLGNALSRASMTSLLAVIPWRAASELRCRFKSSGTLTIFISAIREYYPCSPVLSSGISRRQFRVDCFNPCIDGIAFASVRRAFVQRG